MEIGNNGENTCPRSLLSKFMLAYMERIGPSLEKGRINGLANDLFPLSMGRELIREQMDSPLVNSVYDSYDSVLNALRDISNHPTAYKGICMRLVLPTIKEDVGKIADALRPTPQ